MTLHFSDLLSADEVFVDVDAGSKKHALQILSHALADVVDPASDDEVFQALLERERLGCTATTGGVALPHARIEGIQAPLAVLLKLRASVDFDSNDTPDVDMLFGFLIPLETSDDDETQLRRLTNTILDQKTIESMRAATDAQSLYGALMGVDDTANLAALR